MIRITKLTDYALVILSHAAQEPEAIHNSRDLAETSGLPLPTVSKLLKALSRAEEKGIWLERVTDEEPDSLSSRYSA